MTARLPRLLAFTLASAAGLLGAWVVLSRSGVDIDHKFWSAKKALMGAEEVGIWRDSDRYGWEHVPSSSGMQRVVPDFEVTYTIGPDGNRITGDATGADRPVVLFLGGSFTFGHGVEDDEPFSALLQAMWPQRRVVNAAVNAWGTAQAMLKLEEQLAGEDTIALVVYSFITHHMQRNYRRQSWLRSLMEERGRRNPWFEILDRRLVFQGLADAERDRLLEHLF